MYLEIDLCEVMVQHCESTERIKGKPQVDRDGKVIMYIFASEKLFSSLSFHWQICFD